MRVFLLNSACVHVWTHYGTPSDVAFGFCVGFQFLCIILISFCGLRAFKVFGSVCVCVCVCVSLLPPPRRPRSQVAMNHVSANLLFKGALRTEWKVTHMHAHTCTHTHTHMRWPVAGLDPAVVNHSGHHSPFYLRSMTDAD